MLCAMRRQRFLDYVVVVTGASSGIGAALAQAFAREGACVVLAGRREDRLQDLARRIAAFQPRVLALPCDVTNEDQVRALVAATLQRFGRIDVLVNNAGILIAGPTAELGDRAVRTMLDTNVRGLLTCTRLVVPHMRERGYGHIVQISSIAGFVSLPPIGVYAATKHAVQAIADALRIELSGTGIHVTSVCPGPVASELGQRGPDRRTSHANLGRLAANAAAARILDAVYLRRREVFMPGILRFAALADALVPGLVGRIGARIRR